MAKRKQKKPSLFARWRQRLSEVESTVWTRWGWRCARVCVVVALAIGAGYGLLELEKRVRQSPGQQAPPRLELVDIPPDIEPDVRAALEPFGQLPWSEPTLCEEIAAVMRDVGWVHEVKSVRRYPDRRIEVTCDYRRPVAMVRDGESFYLIDEHAVRLPGRYVNDSTLPLIQGVASAAPTPGATWPGDDVLAGLAVSQIVAKESFADQIAAVLVSNYGGREDPRAAHLQLATDRAGGRIIWGSAPGEEIEENTVEAKLRLLRSNFRRFGRVDAGREVIDISVHPDRVITSR